MRMIERRSEIVGALGVYGSIDVTPASREAVESAMRALYKEHYEIEQRERRYGHVQASLWLSGSAAEMEAAIDRLSKENLKLMHDVDTHNTMLTNTAQMKDDACKALTGAQADLDKYKKLFLEQTVLNQEKDGLLRRLQGQIDYLEEGVHELQEEKKEIQSRVDYQAKQIELGAGDKIDALAENAVFRKQIAELSERLALAQRETELPLLPAELGGVATTEEVAARLKKKRRHQTPPGPVGMPGGAGGSA
jgi:chromosome segregation ATPase